MSGPTIRVGVDLDQFRAITRALELYELRTHDEDEYLMVRSMRRRLQARLLELAEELA